MPLTKTAQKLISTWPQRLALSGAFAFIIWSIMQESILIFATVTLIVHLVLTLMYSRVSKQKEGYNEEMRY